LESALILEKSIFFFKILVFCDFSCVAATSAEISESNEFMSDAARELQLETEFENSEQFLLDSLLEDEGLWFDVWFASTSTCTCFFDSFRRKMMSKQYSFRVSFCCFPSITNITHFCKAEESVVDDDDEDDDQDDSAGVADEPDVAVTPTPQSFSNKVRARLAKAGVALQV
jgi:hypothetical protein